MTVFDIEKIIPDQSFTPTGPYRILTLPTSCPVPDYLDFVWSWPSHIPTPPRPPLRLLLPDIAPNKIGEGGRVREKSRSDTWSTGRGSTAHVCEYWRERKHYYTHASLFVQARAAKRFYRTSFALSTVSIARINDVTACRESILCIVWRLLCMGSKYIPSME